MLDTDAKLTFAESEPLPFFYFLHVPRTGGRALEACALKVMIVMCAYSMRVAAE